MIHPDGRASRNGPSRPVLAAAGLSLGPGRAAGPAAAPAQPGAVTAWADP
jgi:hypothetical protein